MIVAIHQPNFMPWFGFFHKIAKADLWIVLDHVNNNPKDAAFLGRRVKILLQGKPAWLSMPLIKPKGTGGFGIPINQMEFNLKEKRTWEKGHKTLQMAYENSPYFEILKSLVEDFFHSDEPLMMSRNMRFIEDVMSLMRIKREIVYSSSLAPEGTATEMLIGLLKKVGAKSYLCGMGSSGYLDDSLFASAGIELIYDDFVHPVYAQYRCDTFVPGLSIIDSLAMVGEVQVGEWLTE